MEKIFAATIIAPGYWPMHSEVQVVAKGDSAYWQVVTYKKVIYRSSSMTPGLAIQRAEVRALPRG